MMPADYRELVDAIEYVLCVVVALVGVAGFLLGLVAAELVSYFGSRKPK